MAKFRTHYDNLKVARKAPIGVIKAAYKALCQSYHPDKYEGKPEQAHQIMKLINEAYVVLSDPNKRAEHDRWIDKKIREFTLASSAQETANEERPGYKINTGRSRRNTDPHNNNIHPNNAGDSYSSQNYQDNAKRKNHSWIA